MKRINLLVDQLQAELNRLGYTDLSTCVDNEKALKFVEDTLLQLKEYITINSFKEEADEILFFKEIKPSISSKYWFLAFAIEYSNHKFVSKNVLDEYVKNKTTEFELLLQDNKNYLVQLKQSDLVSDSLYYIRQKFCPPPNSVGQIVKLNPLFTTFHSEIHAKLMAYRLIQKYVANENQDVSTAAASGVKWTKNKAALIELMYGLHFANAINNGEADIKFIKNAFEQFFNIDLGNAYRTFHEIKNRNERTIFLDKLRITLENRIDDEDGFFSV